MKKNNKFKPGDVVMLNSGGPWMAVYGIDRYGHVSCMWFGDDGVVGIAEFEPECLTPKTK